MKNKRDKKGMSYHFRFLNLKKVKAKNLADALGQHQPEVRQRFDKRGYCLSLRLNKRVKAKILNRVMRKHGIKGNETDIFISLLTQKDTDIIDVPENVTEVLRITYSKLTFSFTYVG